MKLKSFPDKSPISLVTRFFEESKHVPFLRDCRIFILGLILLLACGNGHADEPTIKTDVLLWHQWTAERREILEAIIKDFNCRSKDIHVIPESLGPSSGTAAERIRLGAGAGRVPDLALVEREAIPGLADSAAIRPLKELIEASSGLRKKDLLASARSYATYDGSLYSLPAYLNPYVLIYDPDLLRKIGASPPNSWDDLFKLAEKINEGKHENAGWVMSLRSVTPVFHILCAQKGVDPLNADGNAANASAVGEAVRLMRDLRRAKSLLSPQYKFWDPNFQGAAGGRVLFQIDDAAMFAALKKDSQSLSVAAMPSDYFPPRTSLSAGPVFVIPRSAGNGRAIAEFLGFFYSPAQYARLADEFLFVSPFREPHSVTKKMAPGTIQYPMIVSAAAGAGVSALQPDSAKALSQIARSLGKLDAGLISPERAREDILAVSKEREPAKTASPTGALRITWAESTRRLFPGEASEFRNPPVEISAARNEHESFQLAVYSEFPRSGLVMGIAPFSSDDGYSRRLKTMTCLEIDTLISKPVVSDRAGPYPNVLKPQTRFNIKPGELLRVWVDIFVPEDASAGVLSSRLRIENQGSTIAEIPIRLRVFPFGLPTAPSKPAVIGLNYDLIGRYYGLKNTTGAYKKLADTFYWFLADRRLSPYQPPVPIDAPGVATYLRDERVSACRIPFPPQDPRFQKSVRLAKEGGWLGKMFVYFIDEPTYHQYKAIVETGEKLHSADISPKFLVTCFPDEQLIGSVDIWCIHLPFLPVGIPRVSADRQMYLETVDRRREAGDEIWWYTAGAIRPFPTLHIEDDPAAFRIIPWLQQLYQIDGFLHWESANWSQAPEDPFVEHFGNGEGVLLYPGNSRPLSSIRLELLREGLEDMEQLFLLRRGLEGVQRELGAESLGDIATTRVKEMCRRLISDEGLRAHASQGVFLLPHFIREPGNIEQVRREVMQENVELRARPFALVLTDPEEKQYTYNDVVRIYGAVEPGSQVTIDGHESVVGVTGRFSARLPLPSGENVFLVRVKHGKNSKVITRKIQKF